MLLKNAKLVLKDRITEGSLLIENGKISAVIQDPDAECPCCRGDEYDAGGKYVMPGFVDLHTHGSGGYDFMDGSAEDIANAAENLASFGTTTCLPSATTCPDEDLFLFLDNFNAVRKNHGRFMSKMPGLHLEGPYFSPEKHGAQDKSNLKKPVPAHYEMILERAQGAIKRWSLAPELEGSMQFIDTLVGQNILASAAHTNATYDIISEAYDHGLRQLTHFYSGMSSLMRVNGYRVLGVVEAGYLIDGLNLELICDGIHLPKDMLRLVFKCKDNSRITGCSDSMRGAGMPEGVYYLGPKRLKIEVIVEDGIAKLPDRSAFAASVATGARLASTLHNILGLDMSAVSRILSLQPAALIGMDNEIGSIEKGKCADLVVCDDSLNISKVFINGKSK